MKLTLPDLPNWTFDADEVAMGVYRIRGTNQLGWTLDLTATSEEELVLKAKGAAHEMELRNRHGLSET